MKFSMNFWVWSLCEFCFLMLVPLTLWLSIWNDTSALFATSHVATSSSVYHIEVFCNRWWRYGSKPKRL